MQFFDWLLGNSQIGWLKTALLSGFLGLALLAFISGYEYGSSGGVRFMVIFAGIFPLILIRMTYWAFRRRQLRRWLDEGRGKAISAILALPWRRPSVAADFQEVIEYYRLQYLASREDDFTKSKDD